MIEIVGYVLICDAITKSDFLNRFTAHETYYNTSNKTRSYMLYLIVRYVTRLQFNSFYGTYKEAEYFIDACYNVVISNNKLFSDGKRIKQTIFLIYVYKLRVDLFFSLYGAVLKFGKSDYCCFCVYYN